MDEWMEETWSVHTVEGHAASRKKKIVSFATPWMDTEGILLNEINQSKQYRMISLPCGFEKASHTYREHGDTRAQTPP